MAVVPGRTELTVNANNTNKTIVAVNPPPPFDNKQFLILFSALIVSWIIYSLWAQVIDTLAYKTLGLDIDNIVHVVVIAIVGTTIFVAFLVYLEHAGNKLKEGMIGFTPQDIIIAARPPFPLLKDENSRLDS